MNIHVDKKILDFGNYIFIDTETANSNQDIVQIGAIIVTNGIVEKLICEYVKPFDGFESKNIKKNKIYPDMVSNSESFNIIWSKIFEKYSESHIFVAHNASFDLAAISKSLQAHGKTLLTIQYLCTQMIARRLGLPYEKREDLCKYFNLCVEKTHDALSDAKDCCNLFLKLYELCGGKIGNLVKKYYSKEYCRKEITEDITLFLQRENHKFSTKRVNSESFYDETDMDFRDQKITITGDFSRYPEREDLAIELRKRGAHILASSNLAKATTMLIAGSNAGHRKLERARERAVRIIDEATLYRMLEDNNAICVEGQQMNNRESLTELLNIVKNVCKDGIVSTDEVGKLQDWVDENAAEFIGEEYNTIIIPLQHFLDNGEFCDDEQMLLIKIINTMIAG